MYYAAWSVITYKGNGDVLFIKMQSIICPIKLSFQLRMSSVLPMFLCVQVRIVPAPQRVPLGRKCPLAQVTALGHTQQHSWANRHKDKFC